MVGPLSPGNPAYSTNATDNHDHDIWLKYCWKWCMFNISSLDPKYIYYKRNLWKSYQGCTLYQENVNRCEIYKCIRCTKTLLHTLWQKIGSFCKLDTYTLCTKKLSMTYVDVVSRNCQFLLSKYSSVHIIPRHC